MKPNSLTLLSTATLALAVSMGAYAQGSTSGQGSGSGQGAGSSQGSGSAQGSGSSQGSRSGQGAGANLSHQDKEFVKDAAENNAAEIASSQLALQHASSGDVKSFAQMMIDDHTKTGNELKGLADQKGVKISDSPSLMQKTQAKMLAQRKGASFDQHYAESIGVKAHQDTIKIFQKEADKGTDPELKAWAAKTLPALQQHLQQAQALKSKTDAEPKS